MNCGEIVQAFALIVCHKIQGSQMQMCWLNTDYLPASEVVCLSVCAYMHASVFLYFMDTESTHSVFADLHKKHSKIIVLSSVTMVMQQKIGLLRLCASASMIISVQ